MHLGISEEREAYYCYREPDRHSGRNVVTILIRLGVHRNDAVRLFNRHTVQARTSFSAREEPVPDKHPAFRQWARFEPLTLRSHPAAYAYLGDRGFSKPEEIAKRFDIRVAPQGAWAMRLLIPFYYEGAVESWTGRALREHMVPKYLTHEHPEGSKLVYSPHRISYPTRKLVIVEGPLDALKIAAAVPEEEYLVVALAGKYLNAGRMLRIMNMLGDRCPGVLLALDRDVANHTITSMISELASHLKMAYISRARLPSYAKDPAELPLPEIPEWLSAQFSMRT